MSGTTDTFDLETCRIERGVTLIEASAGTGKTYSLAAMVLRLLLEGHVSSIGKILVMTFTRAATAELVERIRGVVRDAANAFEAGESENPFLSGLVARHGSAGLAVVRAALRDLDDIEVATIHGFCRRVLDQNALEVGVPFQMDYVANDRVMLIRAAESVWRRTVYSAGPLAARVIADRKLEPRSFLEAYAVCRRHPRVRVLPEPTGLEDAIMGLEAAGDRDDALVEDFVHALRARFIREIAPLFEQEKRVTSSAGYDDLLHRLHASLGDPATRDALRRVVRAQFDAVLVDEFQDTDEIQLEIFEGLFSDIPLLYVGDPKQAIYTFRGADVFAYLRAKGAADRVYTMGINWRSETPLVSAVNALFGRVEMPFSFDAIPFLRMEAAGRADEEALTGDGRTSFEWLWLAPGSNKDKCKDAACEATTREIVRLLDPSNGARIGARAVLPRDIAILVRWNRDATLIQDALRKADVPAVVSQAGSVFQSDEAHELDLLLRAVLDPRQAGTVRAALATRTWGLDAEAIAEISEDESRWQVIGETLAELRATWLARGFAAMASRLLDTAKARTHLLAAERGQRRLTNLLHLIELGQQAIVELALSPDGFSAWLAQRIADSDNSEDKEVAELRLESDADAVQILTIHKSKGLEYGIVFIPFAWDSKGRGDKSAALVHLDGDVVYHFPKIPDAIARAHDDEIASDDARLAYVALTRAKHRCYVAWGAFGKVASRNAALARLVDPSLPASLAERSTNLKDDARDALNARWRSELGDFCKSIPTLIAIRDFDPSSPSPSWQAAVREPAELRLRPFPDSAKPRLEPWRIASFSSFSSAAAERAPASRRIVETPDYVDPEVELELLETTPRGIFAFARGARAGSCLHEIFEKTDFARVNRADLETTVTEALAKYDFLEKAAHKGEIDPVRDVTDAVRTVLEVALPGETFALSTVSRARKLSEWQFYLPMATVSAAGFADVLEKHGAKLASSEYAASLRALAGRGVEGFLTGFVDLVFMHDDRWFIVDWKSNHLGNDARAYDDTAIARAMREHHYVLQYHLYVLALHRYLRQRVPDYDYDRHLGGVYYAFLRGISRDPKPGSTTGWFRDRPSRALVEALDSLVGGRT